MKKSLTLIAGSLFFLAGQALAQTVVKEPWIRGTVAQQKATGMFAQITSSTGGTLVSASSSVAGLVEIHEMVMDGNVMKMRALPRGLELPAGKAVELKPGGYHVMLMDLKQEVKAGDSVVVTLVVESKDGKQESIDVKALVKALGAPMTQGMSHHKH